MIIQQSHSLDYIQTFIIHQPPHDLVINHLLKNEEILSLQNNESGESNKVKKATNPSVG